ncbi:unnamed protein product [Psylliodes chrysocephalus]|uniref:Uncharacterized protein n=1 Tax=Psylliodes chrysocephalus TaxID=3402493 RepID=A0A9P0CIY0_9CUCU|nr:unnamed protein product [Psylliodes chrysocephala]
MLFFFSCHVQSKYFAVSDEDVEVDGAVFPLRSKKRKSHGRMKNVAKLLKLRSHETGPSCNNCTRFKCFENVTEGGRLQIIKQFNELKDHYEQNLYLGGLISHAPVKRHRSRKNNDEDVEYHSYSYIYKIRVQRDNTAIVPIYYKAMLSMHGISAKRLQNIQQQLTTFGHVKHDGRGQHSNRKNRLPDEISTAVFDHIASFKGRKSHYSLHDSQRVYLLEDLNVKKMFNMFLQQNPEKKVSYETYRTIFVTKFNIRFGYPQTDTCSAFDEHKAKKMSIENDPLQKALLSRLETEHKLHLLKAETFYKRKRAARLNSQKSTEKEAIAIDFQKKLPVPNISTNDVYYKRQLSFYYNTIIL